MRGRNRERIRTRGKVKGKGARQVRRRIQG